MAVFEAFSLSQTVLNDNDFEISIRFHGVEVKKQTTSKGNSSLKKCRNVASSAADQPARWFSTSEWVMVSQGRNRKHEHGVTQINHMRSPRIVWAAGNWPYLCYAAAATIDRSKCRDIGSSRGCARNWQRNGEKMGAFQWIEQHPYHTYEDLRATYLIERYEVMIYYCWKQLRFASKVYQR